MPFASPLIERHEGRPGTLFFALLALVAAGCSRPPERHGVYRSGANAIVSGTHTGEVMVWGPEGTVTRLASPAPGGNTLLGAEGPLWQVDHDVPAPPRAAVVAATTVERAGFRMQEILGTRTTGAVDPAKAGGVYVRSVVKVRRTNEPPVYLVSATGDEVGAGKMGGPPDVRAGANCKAAVGVIDAKADGLISGVELKEATRICAVPSVVPPVDIDADGKLDVLVYGQNGAKGFRSWFRLEADGTLVPTQEEVWEDIP